jgi:ribosome biogenesis protein ERB1
VFLKTVKQIAWHHKGDYFSTVAPEGDKNGVSIHQLSQQRTQYPFRRAKGQVQAAVFHPSKPIFFVASQRFIRVYDLLKQKLLTKVHTRSCGLCCDLPLALLTMLVCACAQLEPACKWVSSMEAHPGGDNIVVGSYDMRVCWFDLDLSSRPYKTIRNHKGAVRRIVFHPKYVL